jgi:hypothetical protein
MNESSTRTVDTPDGWSEEQLDAALDALFAITSAPGRENGSTRTATARAAMLAAVRSDEGDAGAGPLRGTAGARRSRPRSLSGWGAGVLVAATVAAIAVLVYGLVTTAPPALPVTGSTEMSPHTAVVTTTTTAPADAAQAAQSRAEAAASAAAEAQAALEAARAQAAAKAEAAARAAAEAQAAVEAARQQSSAQSAASAAASAEAASAAGCATVVHAHPVTSADAIDDAMIRALVQGCGQAWGLQPGYRAAWVRTTVGSLEHLLNDNTGQTSTVPVVAIMVQGVLTGGAQNGADEVMLIRLFPDGSSAPSVEVPVTAVDLGPLGAVRHL